MANSVIDGTPLIHCVDCGAGYHQTNRHLLNEWQADKPRCVNLTKCAARQRGISTIGFKCAG